MNYANPERLTSLCQRLGLNSERARCVSDDLVERYSEKHRAYHNLSHIDHMLSWLDTSESGTDSIELAIWFHDAIYEPLDNNNEAKSAQYLKDQLGAYIGSDIIANAARLIMATDPTLPRSGVNDEDLIIDTDLSILGSSEEIYDAYRLAVRKEYSVVTEAQFISGRTRILEHFLSRPIYVTPFFSQLEEQARTNIQRELKYLAQI